MKPHPWHIRFWQRAVHWAITVEGETVWWCGDDNHQRTRKLDFEVRWPRWVFRPICWLIERGHTEHYGCCVICDKPMPVKPKYIRVNLNAWRTLVWPRVWLHLKVRFCMLLER